MIKKIALFLMVCIALLGIHEAWGDPVILQIPYEKEVPPERISKYPYQYPVSSYTFRFSLWDAEKGGAQVWSEEKVLPIEDNKVKTYLGDTNPLDGVDFSQQMWVQVEKYMYGRWKKMGARDRLNVSPYSVWSVSEASWTIGLHCWDLNDDYNCDEEEDKNDDMICDALDCQGSQGPQGEKGEQGEQGPQGDTGEQGPTGPPGVTQGSSRIVAGSVNADGTKASGTGFTVLLTGATGSYRIAFTPSFVRHPNCTCTPLDSDTICGQKVLSSTVYHNFYIKNLAGERVNSAFSFICTTY